MIVDCSTRVFNAPEQLGRETAAAIRRSTAARGARLESTPAAHERATQCVAASLVLGFRSSLLSAGIPDEFVAEVVRAAPTRTAGISGVDPMSPTVAEDLTRAVELGMVAVSICPSAQGFHPTHSDAMRLYSRLEEMGLPLFVGRPGPLVTTGHLEFDRPVGLDEVARQHPRLKIMIGELGWPWIDETLAMLVKHPNVHAEISGVVSRPWQLYNALLSAQSMGVLEKLFFGSGFPYEQPAKAIENLYSVNAFAHGTQLPAIPRTALRAIAERDVFTLFGMDSPAAHATRRGEPTLEGDLSRDFR
ncbi:MAG: amidohydrolase family protein [Phycisphaerales bacterium]